jgi:adenylate cyclase
MALSDDLKQSVDDILAQSWDIRDGTVVPETKDVALAGGGVNLEATILYSDLAESTRLVTDFDGRTAARVMKAFLACSSRIIRTHGGDIRSFDGDRVMGIFIGDSKNTSAANSALKINWAMTEVIRPKVEAKYPILSQRGFTLRHATGVDRSTILAVRGGVHGANDLIWVGRAGAVAAKLSSLRVRNYTSYVTADVYNTMAKVAKVSSDGKDMWELMPAKQYGLATYRSTWWRRP